MQENKPCDSKELICINVDKVYDWIVKEKSFDISPTGPINFTPATLVPSEPLSSSTTVTCNVAPATSNSICILQRENRPFSIAGGTVYLQQLTIQKNFVLTIFVTLPNGTLLTSDPIPVSRCEKVTLSAPEGTDVEITYTNLDCFVCSIGTITGEAGTITFSDLTISVTTCQSIQSTCSVTVEFSANYCEPRADLAIACSPPVRPKQCSVIFPDTGHSCH